ncbi:MaoC/PaaZ C-terminal domain-containing protein [Marmoricola sp. RAF53]|uniref:MaoC/PaaZ C-terminal domain-containing protein n=1 Tax=Marmoricola sp. RAF53 TaxID=3233059 RepID=UPI003F9B6DD3
MSTGFGQLRESDVFVSAARTVTTADIVSFAGLTGDFNPLHVDEVWVAEHTEFGRCIAHGLLTTSIGSGLRCAEVDVWDIQAYLSVRRDMVAPVYPGDTIRQRMTVGALRTSRSLPGHGVVELAVEIVNQAETCVQRGVDVLLVGPGVTTDAP